MSSNHAEQHASPYGLVAHSILSPNYRWQGDPEVQRLSRHFLQHIKLYANESVLDLRKSWGYTIIRTAYGPGTDEQHTRALTLIKGWIQWGIDHEANEIRGRLCQDKNKKEAERRFAELLGQTWEPKKSDSNDLPPYAPDDLSPEPDPVPTLELRKRLHLDEIVDPALEGAELGAVRDRFRAWVDTKYVPLEDPHYQRARQPHQSRNVRFRTCIWLDKETLDQLSTAPDAPKISNLSGYDRERHFPTGIEDPVHHSWKLGKKHWLKIVESYPPDETEPDRRAIPHSEWARLWVGNLFIYWYDRLADFHDPNWFNLAIVNFPEEGPDAYYFEPEKLAWRHYKNLAAEDSVETLLQGIRENVEKLRSLELASRATQG